MERVFGESSTSLVEISKLVPPGFHFDPHDWELIMHYVKNKNSGWPLPVEIPEEDINSRHPKRLKGNGFRDSPDDYDKEYYFTQRKFTDPKRKRVKRRCSTGEGYWKNTSKDIPIEDENKKLIGYKRTFTFFEGKNKPTNWIMHEFRDREEKCSTIDRYVLCMIYERIQNRCITTLPSLANEEVGESSNSQNQFHLANEEAGESSNSQNQFHLANEEAPGVYYNQPNSPLENMNPFRQPTEESYSTDFFDFSDFNYQQPGVSFTEGFSSYPTESVHNDSELWDY